MNNTTTFHQIDIWFCASYNVVLLSLFLLSLLSSLLLFTFSADVSSTVTSVSSNVIIEYTGNVTWLSMSIFRSSCSIDVKYFPYDIQNCTMEFASWTYGMDKLNIISHSDNGDITNYVPSSEWALLEYTPQRSLETFSCCPDEPVPFMKYYIVIKRRPLFYLFNMVMPCVLITIVALLGFYMPPESGEKVSMGITTLLSIVVFLMIVAESMPPTSDVVPLIGKKNIFVLTFCSSDQYTNRHGIEVVFITKIRPEVTAYWVSVTSAFRKELCIHWIYLCKSWYIPFEFHCSCALPSYLQL